MFFKKIKEKADKINKDNRGLSLVELIVTVLLMSVISGMIVLFIASSRSNYELISTETALQTEAQAATGFIYDILLESENVIFGEYDATLVGGTGSDKVKVLSAKSGDNYSVVLFEEGSGNLRYTSMSAIEVASDSVITVLNNRAGAGNNLIGDKYSLLAEYVTDMTYTEYGVTSSAITYSNVNLDFEYAGRNYRTTIDVKGRNAKE